jgi:hypothetical protein
VLGYYTGTLDGNFGSGTTRRYATSSGNTALRWTLHRQETSNVLNAKAVAAISGTPAATRPIRHYHRVTMTDWNFGNQERTSSQGATATVMDVETQMVFKVKRWRADTTRTVYPLPPPIRNDCDM